MMDNVRNCDRYIAMALSVPLNRVILHLLHKHIHFRAMNLVLIYPDLLLKLTVVIVDPMNARDAHWQLSKARTD
jgi:hypothetical protein